MPRRKTAGDSSGSDKNKENIFRKIKNTREQSFRCGVLENRNTGRLTAADPERRNRPKKTRKALRGKGFGNMMRQGMLPK